MIYECDRNNADRAAHRGPYERQRLCALIRMPVCTYHGRQLSSEAVATTRPELLSLSTTAFITTQQVGCPYTSSQFCTVIVLN